MPGNDVPTSEKPARTTVQLGREQKAAALATLDANGGNVKGTARQLGIPQSTLRTWVKQAGGNPALERLRARKRKTLSEKFDKLSHRLAGVAYKKAHLLDAYRATLAACAATDKRLLLDGMPTSITASHSALVNLAPSDLSDFREFLLHRAQQSTPVVDALPVSDTPLSLTHPSTHTDTTAVDSGTASVCERSVEDSTPPLHP